MRDGIQIRGIFKLIHKQSGLVLIDESNTIHEDLYQLFVAEIELTSLFDAGEVEPGSTQDGNDGITIYDNDNAEWLTMVTTEVTPTYNYARKWLGEFTSTITREVTQFSIGRSYEDSSPYPFNAVFAYKVVNPVELILSNDYEATWEIVIAQLTDLPEPPET